MKRKRGRKHKFGKAPKVAVVGVSDADGDVGNLSEQDMDMSGGDSGPTTVDDIKDETNARTKVEAPVLTVTDQPVKPPSVGLTEVSDKPSDKPVAKLVYNRVKVRIKTPKALEPQLSSEVVQTQGDGDKSSQRIVVEKQAVVSEKQAVVSEKQAVVSEKVEDSATANSTPETNAAGPPTQPRIKIKTSLKGFSSTMSPCNNTVVPPVERVPPVEKVQPVERTHQKEPEIVNRDSVYNKQELNASLEVIKKIMKMDAAEPFKAPVNPVALGIPDYFDVIKTPMDFGTICKNLESGIKYMNSEDVHKDVQFIWENCYKYNNKGDYVLELMKRVKKNFSKYWSAAGLYSEQGDVKDGNTSSHGKSSNKGGNLKNKSKKSRGVKRHKDDCLCAICIMVRRRQERERLINPADDQTETSDGGVKEVKHQHEGTSIGDDTSSSTDNSQNQDDVEMEDAVEKLKPEKESQSTLESKHQEEKETPLEGYNEIAIAERSQQDIISVPDENEDIQLVEAGDANKDDPHKEQQTKQHDNEPAAAEPPKHKEVLDAGEKAKISEKLHKRYNNPLVLELYSSLYRGNDKSVWSRPISLGQRRRGSSRSSAISAAITTFMKK